MLSIFPIRIMTILVFPRSYGFKRQHLGHDMMGQVGTPVIAVESGYVEAIGWNQYGGWRLGIRSFDKNATITMHICEKTIPITKP